MHKYNLKFLSSDDCMFGQGLMSNNLKTDTGCKKIRFLM